MFKIGTVAKLKALELEEKLPEEVFCEVLRVVSHLNEVFGEDRDVDFDDGGFVVIAENKEDLNCFAENCVELESPSLNMWRLFIQRKSPI